MLCSCHQSHILGTFEIYISLNTFEWKTHTPQDSYNRNSVLLPTFMKLCLVTFLDNMMYFRSRGPPARSEDDIRHALNIGLIVPFSNFLKKSYEKSVGAAVGNVKKKGYSWSDVYYLDEDTIHMEMMSINPSPTGEI